MARDDLLHAFKGAPAASALEIEQAEHALQARLPADYRSFLLSHDGGSGWVGAHYMTLWPARELGALNEGFAAPVGLILFGSDGGGEAFGFDTRTKPIQVIMAPFIGMHDRADWIHVAASFDHLIERMAGSDSLFDDWDGQQPQPSTSL